MMKRACILHFNDKGQAFVINKIATISKNKFSVQNSRSGGLSSPWSHETVENTESVVRLPVGEVGVRSERGWRVVEDELHLVGSPPQVVGVGVSSLQRGEIGH